MHLQVSNVKGLINTNMCLCVQITFVQIFQTQYFFLCSISYFWQTIFAGLLHDIFQGILHEIDEEFTEDDVDAIFMEVNSIQLKIYLYSCFRSIWTIREQLILKNSSKS